MFTRAFDRYKYSWPRFPLDRPFFYFFFSLCIFFHEQESFACSNLERHRQHSAKRDLWPNAGQSFRDFLNPRRIFVSGKRDFKRENYYNLSISIERQRSYNYCRCENETSEERSNQFDSQNFAHLNGRN